MNAKKTLSMTLAAAMAAGLLAGCGGSSSTAAFLYQYQHRIQG